VRVAPSYIFAFVLWHFALITITAIAIAIAIAIPVAMPLATFKRCFHFARSDSK